MTTPAITRGAQVTTPEFLDLPTDRGRSVNGTAGHYSVRVPITGRTQDWWTALFLAFLHRYSGVGEIPLTGSTGRVHRYDVDPGDTLGTLRARVARPGAAQTVPGGTAPADGGVTVALAHIDQGRIPGDLCLLVSEDGGVLLAAADLWLPETAERMAGQLVTLAVSARARPGSPVSELDLLTREDRARILTGWNDTAADWPDTSYPRLVAEHAAATPDAPALVQGDRVVTFAELETRTNKIAGLLRRLGAVPGERVGLLCPRGADFVLATLGVLKTGAALVPLDPVNPDARLTHMVEDAEPVVVLVTEALQGRAPGGVRVLRVDGAEFDDEPDEAPEVTLTADTVSHLIYTSGSTGRPKAVLERHGALVNLVHWTGRAYGVRPGDRASWLSTPGFAVQLMEWLPYLALGVAIHVGDVEERTPEQVRDWLVSSGITHTMLVAALAERVWPLHWPEGTRLRIMVTTAERVHSWPPVDTPFRVVMTYGSTETTNALSCLDIGAGQDCTAQATPEEIRETRPVPVGRPVANTRAYILDAAGAPVPVGVVGHLHIAGAGVAAGYHRRDELTAAKFRPTTLPEEPEPVLYDTGDLARHRPDGVIELLGRSDAQVKIRGFRVELGEVETVVGSAPGVAEAVVTARPEEWGGLRLVAYVAPASAEARIIRAHVTRRLPQYMVPAVIVALDELPRLPNGKLDLRALPEPTGTGDGTEIVAPRNEIETRLERIWAALFNIERVGVEDNFFELGGHSLLAFRLIDEVRTAFAVELSLPDLYRCPTIEGLAGLIGVSKTEGRSDFGGMSAIEPDPANRFTPFPLTECQQALWVGRGDAVDLGNVGCHGYFEWESDHLDVERFKTAWRRLVERHDALRTIIRPDALQQVLAEPPHYDIDVLDLSDADPVAAAEQLEALRSRLSHQVLDDGHWPLFDVRLSILPGPAWRVRIHLSLDFLISDAWSYFQVLIPDLVQLYEHPDEEMPPLRLSFRDYVLGGRDRLTDSDVYRRSELYWLDRLDTLPAAPVLPARPADQEEKPIRFDRRDHRIDPGTWDRLKAQATEYGVTPSGLLAAVFAEVLRAWSGSERFTINFPIFNRLPLHPDINGLLGDTTTTMLLAVEKADGTFAERAQALQGQLWADLEHRYFSGVQVLRALTRKRGAMLPAMPIVMTSLAGHPPRAFAASLGEATYSISQTPQVSIDFQVFEVAGELQFNWDFLPGLFPDGLVEEMFDAFCAILHRLIDDPATWRAADFGLTSSHELPAADGPEDTLAGRDTGEAWERFWAGVDRTGSGGDVLWDPDNDQELSDWVDVALQHMNRSLPVVDIGCGNGRFTRAFAARFPAAVGTDVSASAIAHAVAESVRTPRTAFQTLDATRPEEGTALAMEIGDANVFVRAVLHVLDDAGRRGFAETVAELTGDRGVLILLEPAYEESSFGYLGFVGGDRGRAATLVRPLERAGVNHSSRFGGEELDRYFRAEDGWEQVTSGGVELAAIDPDSDTSSIRIPGFFAVVRRTRV
ncbi:non-ribosomal peptide synthetase [Rhizohabitans arisaemae]|uniref:non-ribosomal peptide synthetase n=1 Tax=Rhizohabitans arisaemae TaxID=2720610 RepID=UPI0024B16535|nr:non-ribosomal peptide synthetase [Rhizohabitans arisaemae]